MLLKITHYSGFIVFCSEMHNGQKHFWKGENRQSNNWRSTFDFTFFFKILHSFFLFICLLVIIDILLTSYPGGKSVNLSKIAYPV